VNTIKKLGDPPMAKHPGKKKRRLLGGEYLQKAERRTKKRLEEVERGRPCRTRRDGLREKRFRAEQGEEKLNARRCDWRKGMKTFPWKTRKMDKGEGERAVIATVKRCAIKKGGGRRGAIQGEQESRGLILN